jgi:hypothetical protein
MCCRKNLHDPKSLSNINPMPNIKNAVHAAPSNRQPSANWMPMASMTVLKIVSENAATRTISASKILPDIAVPFLPMRFMVLLVRKNVQEQARMPLVSCEDR